MRRIGLIGGSGLYNFPGLKVIRIEDSPDCPYGPPSDKFVIGRLKNLPDIELVFLARHSQGHVHMPHEINHRANIHGMKIRNVRWIAGISAVGSLGSEKKPGDLVLVDQFFNTCQEPEKGTFFGGGIAGHVSDYIPFCPYLREIIIKARLETKGITLHPKGTYLRIGGNHFSTHAASKHYRDQGFKDVIGMNVVYESQLAKEAGICYAAIAAVTDYDCWHKDEMAVNADMVSAVMKENIHKILRLIRRALPMIKSQRRCNCHNSLEHAIMTDPDYISPEHYQQMKWLIGRYIRPPKGK